MFLCLCPWSILCSIVLSTYNIFSCFCLSFEFHFLIYLAPLIHHLLTLFISYFLSLFPLDSFVYSWQKGGEYTGVYTEVFCHFYITHVHMLKGRNFVSCTFIGGESHRGNAYTKGEKTSFMRKPCFVCFTLCLFSRFMVLWVMFSIYALLLSSHCVCVLDMHTSLCYCVFLIACSDDHLLCYMIIVVISIWLSCVWSSCSYVSQYVYLIAFYLLHYTCPFITWFTLRV